MKLLLVNLTSLSFGLMAVWLIAHGSDNWGWFLAAAFLTIHVSGDKE